tara:strand:+ start:204 stop:875 length:672 start_codon:yes stop_codon:yes gene_type:complete
MRKNHSNWREDLREVVDIESSEPETEGKSEVKIGDKKVTNKITINPVMKEAFGQIGALVLEVTELEEESDPQQKQEQQQLKNKEQMMRKQQMLSRQRIQMQKQGRLPMGHSEGLDMNKDDMSKVITDFRKSDAPQFKGKSDKKKQQMAIAAKLNSEESSISDQMKVSVKHNRENPRKPYKPGDGYARNVKDAARNAARKPKDTRTSQQRMNDAVGKSRAGESD